MAFELDQLKRKRARPSDWWVASPSQSTPPHGSEPPLKKRDTKPLGGGGRTIKEVIGAANRGKIPKRKDAAPVDEDMLGKRNKPGRRSRELNTEAELVAEPITFAKEVAPKKKKRGRSSIMEEDVPRTAAPKSTKEPKNKERPRASQMDELAGFEAPTKDAKKKGRPPKPPVDGHGQSEISTKGAGTTKAPRRGRSSNDRAGIKILAPASKYNSRTSHIGPSNVKYKPSSAAKSVAKEGSMRKELAEQGKNVFKVNKTANHNSRSLKRADAELSRVESPTKSKDSERQVVAAPLRRRISGPASTMKRALASSPKESSPKDAEGNLRRKRRSQTARNTTQDLEAALDDSRPPPYQYLTSVTRRVPRHLIESKWEPLTQACIGRISLFLYDIQRPVIVQFDDERKRNQAAAALEIVSRRLVGKLSKGLPFPPGTRKHREDDFDFEKILDLQRGFEAQLTPGLHANELLRAEISKETALLELEQVALADLEANAKAEASMRKQAGRKLHPLLQSGKSGTEEEDELQDLIGLDTKSPSQPLSLTGQNESLKIIIDNLNGHADSIQGNWSQVSGIMEAMAKSKAAVQATLFSYLEGTLYRKVILG